MPLNRLHLEESRRLPPASTQEQAKKSPVIGNGQEASITPKTQSLIIKLRIKHGFARYGTFMQIVNLEPYVKPKQDTTKPAVPAAFSMVGSPLQGGPQNHQGVPQQTVLTQPSTQQAAPEGQGQQRVLTVG